MQIKGKILILSALLLLSGLFVGCSKDGDVELEGCKLPVYTTIYVKFLSPSGTNILDSLNVLGESHYVNANSELIDVNVCKTYTGTDYLYQEVPQFQDFAFGYNGAREAFLAEEICDSANIDMSAYNIISDSYEIRLKSDKIFGNDETHIIKWYYKLAYPSCLIGYKCEVDGERYPIENDSVFVSSIDNPHCLESMITIQIK